MRAVSAFLILSLLLFSCGSQKEKLSLGPPVSRALKTNELAADADMRIAILGKQAHLPLNFIFNQYHPHSVSSWGKNWTRRFNLTGVSWTHRQAGTAITPRHVVMAAHFQMKAGTILTFHERSGKAHSRVLLQVIALPQASNGARPDIAVGLLNRPLPDSIKTYRLLPPRIDYAHTLLGSPVLVTEHLRRLYLHQIRAIRNGSIVFGKNLKHPDSLYKNLIVGDSGHPSFLLVGGEPVLLETHTGGGPGSGPFYSDPSVFHALSQVIAQLDPSYRIQTVPLDPKIIPVPNPSIVARPRPHIPDINVPAVPTSSLIRTPRVRRIPTPSSSEPILH